MRARKDGRGRIDVSPTTVAIVNGTDDLSEWSDEEIVRGQRRKADGNWPATRPKVIAAALHDERVKRSMTKAYRLMREAAPEAIEELRKILKDPHSTRADRAGAAKIILSHVMPKAVQMDLGVTVDATPAFLKVVEASLMSVYIEPEGADDSDILDAEIVVDDDPVIDDSLVEWEADDAPTPPDRPVIPRLSLVQAPGGRSSAIGDLNARRSHPRGWSPDDLSG